jgi:O-antigen/teichoic acid export membrane protein
VGLICSLADPFLSAWLGSEFQVMLWILVVIIFPLSTNMVVDPFFNIRISLNKLKMPALVALELGLLNLLLAILLIPRFEAMGIVAVGILTLAFNNSIYASLYAAKIMNLTWRHYLKRLEVVVVTMLIVAMGSYMLSLAIPLISYLLLIVAGRLVSLVYLTLVHSLWLNGEEKNFAENIYPCRS